jgi:phage terminase small subunit
MNGELTTKRRLFVEAYLASPNATQAAITAGYSKKTAYSIGQRLLKNVEISKALEERIETAIITTDEILTDVKSIAKSSDKDSDRLKAYELLGKHLAMWIDKSESNVTVSKIEVEFIDG